MYIKSFRHTKIKFNFSTTIPERLDVSYKSYSTNVNLKFKFCENYLPDTNYPVLDFLNSSSQNW